MPKEHIKFGWWYVCSPKPNVWVTAYVTDDGTILVTNAWSNGMIKAGTRYYCDNWLQVACIIHHIASNPGGN